MKTAMEEKLPLPSPQTLASLRLAQRMKNILLSFGHYPGALTHVPVPPILQALPKTSTPGSFSF